MANIISFKDYINEEASKFKTVVDEIIKIADSNVIAPKLISTKIQIRDGEGISILPFADISPRSKAERESIKDDLIIALTSKGFTLVNKEAKRFKKMPLTSLGTIVVSKDGMELGINVKGDPRNTAQKVTMQQEAGTALLALYMLSTGNRITITNGQYDIDYDKLLQVANSAEADIPSKYIQPTIYFIQNPAGNWLKDMLSNAEQVYNLLSKKGGKWIISRSGDIMTTVYNTKKKLLKALSNDKWNPGDIWAAKSKSIKTDFNDILEYNDYVNEFNDLIPISLKGETSSMSGGITLSIIAKIIFGDSVEKKIRVKANSDSALVDLFASELTELVKNSKKNGFSLDLLELKYNKASASTKGTYSEKELTPDRIKEILNNDIENGRFEQQPILSHIVSMKFINYACTNTKSTKDFNRVLGELVNGAKSTLSVSSNYYYVKGAHMSIKSSDNSIDYTLKTMKVPIGSATALYLDFTDNTSAQLRIRNTGGTMPSIQVH